jgi:hypothetical protein
MNELPGTITKLVSVTGSSRRAAEHPLEPAGNDAAAAARRHDADGIAQLGQHGAVRRQAAVRDDGEDLLGHL